MINGHEGTDRSLSCAKKIFSRSAKKLRPPRTPLRISLGGILNPVTGSAAERGRSLSFKNLTCYEIDSLGRSYNLTDGHAFRRWTAAEEAIIDRSPQLFKHNSRQMQAAIEREYTRDFATLGKQIWDEDALGYLMCFTASMAFEIIANYLRLERRSLTLIEPCFDNLADIFRRHEVPLSPFPDALLEAADDAFEHALSTIKSDAICLVTPNNPTGKTLSKANLQSLVRFCKHQRKLLILDNCFRAYLPRDQVYDQSRVVLDGGIDVFMVEDTGKTWPTAEIKAPFIAVSRSPALCAGNSDCLASR
jgi:hypothetical protein